MIVRGSAPRTSPPPPKPATTTRRANAFGHFVLLRVRRESQLAAESFVKRAAPDRVRATGTRAPLRTAARTAAGVSPARRARSQAWRKTGTDMGASPNGGLKAGEQPVRPCSALHEHRNPVRHSAR